MLDVIDRKEFRKFDEVDGKKASPAMICLRLHRGISAKAAVPNDTAPPPVALPQDSSDDEVELKADRDSSDEELPFVDSEDVIDLRGGDDRGNPKAEIYEMGPRGTKKEFLYIPQESESRGSIWLGTERRNNFRLIKEEFLEYKDVRQNILDIILKAASYVSIEGQELIDAIDYARRNGGMSNRYNSITEKYEKNLDTVPPAWKLLSRTFQELAKADNLLSSRAKLGLRLTFVPFSVVKDLERMMGVERSSPEISPWHHSGAGMGVGSRK